MGTLQRNKKEQTTNICNNLDRKSVSPRKISSTKKKGGILYNSIYRTFIA